MEYVARFTTTPAADIARGWSAVMGERGNLWSAADAVASAHGIDTNDYETEEELLEALTDLGFEFRQYPGTGDWAEFHHDGLSCWRLEAETAEEAVAEAQELAEAGRIEWAGFGFATEGKIEYVGPVAGIEDLHLFRCESTVSEG